MYDGRYSGLHTVRNVLYVTAALQDVVVNQTWVSLSMGRRISGTNPPQTL